MGKERKNKREYLNDFVLNEEGQYEYKGKVYSLVKGNIDEISKKLSFYSLTAMSCTILGGIVPFSGMNGNASIVIAYLVEFGAVLALAYAIYIFATSRNELRSYKYEKSVERIKPMATIAIIGLVLQTIASVLHLFSHPATWASFVFILMKVGTFIAVKRCLDIRNKLEFKLK